MSDEAQDIQQKPVDEKGWGETWRNRRHAHKLSKHADQEELRTLRKLVQEEGKTSAEPQASSDTPSVTSVRSELQSLTPTIAEVSNENTLSPSSPNVALSEKMPIQSVKVILPANGSIEKYMDSSRGDVTHSIQEITDPIKLGYIHEAAASLADNSAEKVGMFGQKRIKRWPKPDESQEVTIGNSRMLQANALSFLAGKVEPFNELGVLQLDALDSSLTDADPRSPTRNPTNINLQFDPDGITTAKTAWNGPLVIGNAGDFMFAPDFALRRHFLLRPNEGHNMLTKFISENLVTRLVLPQDRYKKYDASNIQAVDPEWFKNAFVQINLRGVPRIIVDQQIMKGMPHERDKSKVKLDAVHLHSEWVYDPSDHQFVFSYGKQGDSLAEREAMEKQYRFISYYLVNRQQQDKYYHPKNLSENDGLLLVSEMLGLLPHKEG